MRLGTLTLLVIVFLGNPFFSAYGETCGLIANWNEQDANSLYSGYEFWGEVGPSDPRPYSALVVDALKPNWRLSIILTSFPDTASADAYYAKRVSDWDTMWGYSSWTIYPDKSNTLTSMVTGPDYISGDKAKGFFLVGKHLGTFVFDILISSTIPFDSDGLPISQLRSEALAIFAKAKMLINAKCGRSTHPPQITFYPYTAGTKLFEMSILKDKGFLIEITDEDGVQDSGGNWQIDFSTLKVLLNGYDITGHFLQTVIDQGLLAKASVLPDKKTFQAMIKLDPEKLLSTHNLFAVSENGGVTVTLSICDVDGICGSKDHQIYFGPFLTFSKVERGQESLDLIDWTNGNTGKECEAELYLAIWNEMSDKFWFFTFYGGINSNQSEWILFENDLVPWQKIPSIAAGSYEYLPKAPIVFYPEKISGNNLYYYMGVLDKSSNEWAIDYGPVE